MDAQLPMWTKARATDPQTSHDAAASMEFGARAQRFQLLQALKLHGPMIHSELDAALGWHAHTANRRLSELRRANLIERTGETRATASGRQAYVYRVVG